eukprot:4420786-Prymnesium_polylepis.1
MPIARVTKEHEPRVYWDPPDEPSAAPGASAAVGATVAALEVGGANVAAGGAGERDEPAEASGLPVHERSPTTGSTSGVGVAPQADAPVHRGAVRRGARPTVMRMSIGEAYAVTRDEFLCVSLDYWPSTKSCRPYPDRPGGAACPWEGAPRLSRRKISADLGSSR